MTEISPETVGGAMRLAMAIAASKPMTTEKVYSIANTNHIAKLTRHRDGETGIVTEHTHCGTTLCGAAIRDVEPYKPANLLTGILRVYGCFDCVNLWFDARGDLT